MAGAARELIWIASFPKSGNTWVRILLSNLLANQETPQDINALFLNEGIVSSRRRFEDITLLDSQLLNDGEADKLRPALCEKLARELNASAFVKTHDAYTFLSDGTPLLGRAAEAAVYVIRDPRDVAVSLAHFWGCSLAAAVRFINDPDGYIGGDANQLRQRVNGWSHHAESWSEQTVVPVHVLRYEDLLADTAGVFARVLSFLAIGADEDAIRRAVRNSSLGELREQEAKNGFREAPRPAAKFFRRGAAGDWRGAMPRELSALIEAEHREMMLRFGYL